MNTDATIKILIVLFICLLSFSIGTFVGKQVSNSDHKRMQLEKEMQESIYGP
jgi:hypothetical protein